MSLYTRAVSAGFNIGDDADVGFSLKRGLKKVGRGIKKTGKAVASAPKRVVRTVARPVKAAARPIFKKRGQQSRPAQSPVATSTPYQGGGDFPESDNGYGEEETDEQYAAEDEEYSDSDAESGDAMSFGNQEIGWEEIGDDVDQMLAGDEYVGAAPQRAVARRPGPNAALVQSKGFSKSREYPLGFSSSGTIAAAASAVITAQPQTLFRPKRLVIPSSIAGSFTIQDIKVGNASQLVASGSLPAALYSELAVGTMQRYDTASPGILISLSVTNTSGGALAFVAAMVGDSVQ